MKRIIQRKLCKNLGTFVVWVFEVSGVSERLSLTLSPSRKRYEYYSTLKQPLFLFFKLEFLLCLNLCSKWEKLNICLKYNYRKPAGSVLILPTIFLCYSIISYIVKFTIVSLTHLDCARQRQKSCSSFETERQEDYPARSFFFHFVRSASCAVVGSICFFWTVAA